MILVPPDTEHSILSLDQSTGLDLKFTVSEGLAERLRKLPEYLTTVPVQVHEIVSRIFEEAVEQQLDFDEFINLKLYQMLILILRAGEKGSSHLYGSFPVPFSANPNINRFLKLVEDHLEEQISVSDLLADCGYNRNYFSGVFKNEIGISPVAYVNLRKITRAREWMLYSGMNISQIAEHLGFEGVNYFSRLFKKVTGMAPTEYIRLYKDNRPINVVRNENTPEGLYEIPVKTVLTLPQD